MASRLAYPEVRAALAAAARNHDLDEADLDDSERTWDSYWAATHPVELTAAVERHAGQLARTYALRGADAVHLASALAIGDPDLILAAWGRRLHGGAQAAGLNTAPAELGTQIPAVCLARSSQLGLFWVMPSWAICLADEVASAATEVSIHGCALAWPCS